MTLSYERPGLVDLSDNQAKGLTTCDIGSSAGCVSGDSNADFCINGTVNGCATGSGNTGECNQTGASAVTCNSGTAG